MATPQASGYQFATPHPSVLTCTNHPTVVGDRKCDQCQKIICLQCYTRWGPNGGACAQCFESLSRGCCSLS